MITFDLINERKIEVRLRIYWFSQDELSMALFFFLTEFQERGKIMGEGAVGRMTAANKFLFILN